MFARIALILAALPLISAAPAPAVTRTLLEQSDIPGTTLEHRLYRISYAPGASAPAHDHPVVGLGYVLIGEFDSQFAGEAVTHVRAGESFIDAANKPHTLFRNPSADTPLVFLVSYAIPKGQAALRTLP